MKKLISVLLILGSVFSTPALAQSSSANMSYDLSGGFGTYNGNSYTEIDLGLNWYLTDYLNWRNSVFTQFGSSIDTVYGLDTAAIFGTGFYTSSGGAGVELFAGPGLRFANEDASGYFGKAGLIFAIGGLRIGGGAQVTKYYESRHDKYGYRMPDEEVQYFIILAGGGSL
ncbi:hypothetical protein [Bdellovibrio sp. HCB209]|uniref:hypothetical protein n=1 Tax=Bdellovibrio sp. HCB209 TaxID=3394354 RepID=UPI0039B42EA4